MAGFRLTRRSLLRQVGTFVGAGILQPLFPLFGSGKTLESAYPEDVLSIERYTHGRVKPGTIIGRDNADAIRDIAPEGLIVELKRGNTEIRIAETTLDPQAFVPKFWYEATIRNRGQAMLDAKGQLWHRGGGPWIGGCPFPDPKSGLEAIWNLAFNPERYDDYLVLNTGYYFDGKWRLKRRTRTRYLQIQTVGRLVVDPKPVIPAYASDLYRGVLAYEAPFDVAGLQLATTVFYDATQLPDTFAYLPGLRRTRRMSSTQRFEPAVADAAYSISDVQLQNDPVLTWSWKLAGRKPMLMPAPSNRGLFGKGKDPFSIMESEERAPKSTWELRPEMLLVDGVPHLQGANYSRKRVYIDVATGVAQNADIWDRAGRLWRYIAYFIGDTGLPDGAGGMAKTATCVVFSDLQNNYHTCVYVVPKRGIDHFKVNSGYRVEDWLTPMAMLKRSRQ
jgi:hypothetical protein